MNFYLLVILIIITIYIYCYFIFPSSVIILQTTIKDFDFNLLNNRQPIVITDFLKEKNKLIDSWFNYNYIVNDNNNRDDNDNDDNDNDNDNDDNDNDNDNNDNNNRNDNDNDEWIHNKYKYVFISANKDTEIIIYKASIYSNIPDENERIIAVKLQKNQSLILPFKWKYYINNYKDINTWGIHDLITFSVGLFF